MIRKRMCTNGWTFMLVLGLHWQDGSNRIGIGLTKSQFNLAFWFGELVISRKVDITNLVNNILVALQDRNEILHEGVEIINSFGHIITQFDVEKLKEWAERASIQYMTRQSATQTTPP